LNRKKNILICPLEWGLGHATRMIPVAADLQKLNHNVIFASGEEHLSLIRKELTGCSFVNFPGFNPKYSRHLPQYISILLKMPLLIYHIILEHSKLKKIIRDHSIDVVISDNRFGLWNKSIRSVYVTHMPLIPFPQNMRFLEPAGIFLHSLIIRKYDLCFIPDLPGEGNISGRLSHGIRLHENIRYIGILSRFSAISVSANPVIESRYNVIILSGPEPQKEMLKQKLIRIFIEKEPVTIILEGKPGQKEETRRTGNVITYNHMPSGMMKSVIMGSEGIISRSGYTTIMDLVALNHSVLLVPTPGQTEQEYLAAYLSEKELFTFISQDYIKETLSFPVKKPCDYSVRIEKSKCLLAQALEELLDEPHQESLYGKSQKKA
jgi:UDP:flavonoid glycosyltransferase YjiC (YdhE family)